LENLNVSKELNRAWTYIKERVKILSKGCLCLYELSSISHG